MTIDLEAQGWFLIYSKDDFIGRYPEPKYGSYRPQPWSLPEKYPCWGFEVAIVNNSNGADHAVIAYLYDITEPRDGDAAWAKGYDDGYGGLTSTNTYLDVVNHEEYESGYDDGRQALRNAIS